MSLIDQALKKTQSALHQQKLQAAAETASASVTRPVFSQLSRNPLHQTKFSAQEFESVGRGKYLMLSLVGLILLSSAASVIYNYFPNIAKRYVAFYGNVFLQTSPVAAVPALPPPAVTTVVKLPALDGTLEIDNERVALINNHLYKAGNFVDGYQIAQVHYNSVLLVNQTNGQMFTLTPTLAQ